MDIVKDDEHRLPRRQAAELSQKCRQCHLFALLRAHLWHVIAVAKW